MESHLLQHLDLVGAHALDLAEDLVVGHDAEPEVEHHHGPDGRDDADADGGGDVHAGGQVDSHHQHHQHLHHDPEHQRQELEDDEGHHHALVVYRIRNISIAMPM